MSIVPGTRIGKITFYEAHANQWKDHAAQLGIDADDATKLLAATVAARASYNASILARDAARAATQDFYNDTSDMATLGAGLLSTIKSYAESTQNPGVYSLAQIPPPATPGPIPAPGTPMDFTVSLMQSGAVELKWKCNNPEGSAGTIYECRRKIGGGALTFIGATGVKSFVDDTLPSGSTGVTYEITAVRSTKRGLPAQFNVNFGVGGDGFAFATVENAGGAPMKMAA
jgi:hypothetical protein